MAWQEEGNSSILHCWSEVGQGAFGSTAEVVHLFTGVRRLLLRGHEDDVSCISCSPDGTRITTGSDDATIRIWSVETEEDLQVLTGNSYAVNWVVFSPVEGEDRLTSCSKDRTVWIWGLKTGKQLVRCGDHALLFIHALAYSPDGRRLASDGDNNLIYIFDTETGERLRVLTGHFVTIQSLAFYPDGNRLVSSDMNSTVRLWDPHNSEPVNTLSDHQFQVSSVAYSPSGDRIASDAWDGTVRFWKTDGVLSDAFSDGQIDKSICWMEN